MPYSDKQVEKIVQEASQHNGEHGYLLEKSVRSALRAYGELMAKKRCWYCRERDMAAKSDLGFIHCTSSDGESYVFCAASDIWESLEER